MERYLCALLASWRAGASQPSRSAGTIFLYIYLSVCRHTVILYVIRNTRQRNFTYTVSCACANIYRFDLTRQLYYSWQVWALLLVVGWCCWLAYSTCTAIIKFLLNSSIIFCRKLVGSLPLANNVQRSASDNTYGYETLYRGYAHQHTCL